jgi:hypothetical protein
MKNLEALKMYFSGSLTVKELASRFSLDFNELFQHVGLFDKQKQDEIPEFIESIEKQVVDPVSINDKIKDIRFPFDSKADHIFLHLDGSGQLRDYEGNSLIVFDSVEELNREVNEFYEAKYGSWRLKHQ